MTCNKCRCNHKKFKNGKLRKTCPKKPRGNRVAIVRRHQKGKGAITDTIKKMAIAYAKKKGKEYLVSKGVIKPKKVHKRPKWGARRESKPRKRVVW